MTIKNKRTVDLVVESIRSSILNGTHPIGSRLPAERALSETLGVNRLTLRAAISYLEAEGLVKAQQGHGVTVCNFYKKASIELLCHYPIDNRLHEILSLRQLVLAEAVSHACIHATIVDIHRLQSILQKQRKETDDELFLERDAQFLMVLVESSQQLTLKLLFNSLKRIVQSNDTIGKHLLQQKQQAIGSYQVLLGLLKHKDPALSKKAILGHLSAEEKQYVTQILSPN